MVEGLKPWTIDIGLRYYQEYIKKNPMKEQELNKDYLSSAWTDSVINMLKYSFAW